MKVRQEFVIDLNETTAKNPWTPKLCFSTEDPEEFLRRYRATADRVEAAHVYVNMDLMTDDGECCWGYSYDLEMTEDGDGMGEDTAESEAQ